MNEIEVIAFDMDDLIFSKEADQWFWEVLVPEILAKKWKMEEEKAGKIARWFYGNIPRGWWWHDCRMWSYIFGVDLEKVYRKAVIPLRKLLVNKELFKKLSEKFVVGIETNAPLWIAEALLEKERMRRHFSFIFSSDIAKTTKSSLSFYEKFLEFVKEKAENVLIVAHDEKEKKAEKIGMRVIVTSPQNLEKDLEKVLGLTLA